MKELETHSKVKEEIKAIKPIQKEKQLLATLKPQKGHRCFEINTATGEINEALFDRKNVHYRITGNISGFVKKELLVKEGCVYITALNKENALKKYQNSKK
jgi:hypothetical protein